MTAMTTTTVQTGNLRPAHLVPATSYGRGRWAAEAWHNLTPADLASWYAQATDPTQVEFLDGVRDQLAEQQAGVTA